jgi:phospholipase/carboxylesterase
MPDIKLLTGPELAPASGGKAKQLIVFLHGIGADGNDLISLAYEMAADLPDAHFISPNALEPFDMAPFGYQWFSLKAYADNITAAFDQAGRYEGAKHAAPALNHFLDTMLQKLRLSDKDLVLVGFSQGTMMALHVGLRRKHPPACIVGFSGALLGSELLPAEIISRPPVCLIHGEDDPVVPFYLMERAEKVLKKEGIIVETHGRPMLPHGIDGDGIEIATGFIRRSLGLS